jgi:fibronectin-binding autotransporter adhesin
VLLNPIIVASDGSGTATIGRSSATGTTTYNGTITLDRSATFTNNGATLVFLKSIGGAGGATFDGGGTTVIAANNSYSGGTTISLGVVNVGNGGSTGTIPGDVTNNSSMRFNRTDAYTFSGTISGVGNVRSINSGTVTLTAANTYGGGTIIEEGRIIANNTSGSATGTNSVTINSDGTLSGTGSVAGAVQVNAAGRLAAGDPLVSGNRIESLAIGSGLSFVGASHFDYEIQSNAALNVAADAVVVTGNLSLSSAASLNLTDLAGVSATILANGVKLTLISYSGAWNGTTFASRPNGSFVTLGPNQFTLSYNDSARGLNFTTDIANGLKYVTLTSIAAVPEASTVVFGSLLCLAIGGVAAARKRLGHLDAADASAPTSCGRSPIIVTTRTRVLPKLGFSRFF